MIPLQSEHIQLMLQIKQDNFEKLLHTEQIYNGIWVHSSSLCWFGRFLQFSLQNFPVQPFAAKSFPSKIIIDIRIFRFKNHCERNCAGVLLHVYQYPEFSNIPMKFMLSMTVKITWISTSNRREINSLIHQSIAHCLLQVNNLVSISWTDLSSRKKFMFPIMPFCRVFFARLLISYKQVMIPWPTYCLSSMLL